MIWVQSILFFILGSAVTGFLVMLVFPLIWRRALFLANKAVRMEVPISLNEVEVERDFLRAEHATEVARLEELLKMADDRYAQALLDISKVRERNYYLLPFEQTTRELSSSNKQLGSEIITLKQELNAAKSIQHQKNQIEDKLADVEEKYQQALALIKDLRGNLLANNETDVLDLNLHDGGDRHEVDNESENEISRLYDDNLHLQAAHQQAVDVLRGQIKIMAAMLVANVAVEEGDKSPILEFIAKAEDPDSLAGLIKTNVTSISSKAA